MWLYQSLGGEVSISPRYTLGLYVKALEYTELLNGLIFDRVYGS